MRGVGSSHRGYSIFFGKFFKKSRIFAGHNENFQKNPNFRPFYDVPRPILGEKKIFFLVKNRLVLPLYWCRLVHRSVFCVTTDGQNTRFLHFFAFFGAQRPTSVVEIFPKKKFFF